MSSFDELLEKALAEEEEKKKKKKQEAAAGTLTVRKSLNPVQSLKQSAYDTAVRGSDFYYSPKKTVGTLLDDDIAPVKTVKKKDEDEGLDFFQKGAFSDGYQAGDISKAILGTIGDVGLGIAKGAGSMLEGVADLINYGIAGVADKAGKDDFAERVRKNTQKSAIDAWTKDADDYLNQYSILGKTSDSVAQGIGQVGTILLTGGIAGAAGLGAAGATAVTTGAMGLSGMGSGMSEAYQGGATDSEAATYGMIAGAADALSELIFGGLGKAVKATGLSTGLSSADDMLAKKVSGLFKNHIAKNLAEFGVKASAEGMEEVVAGIAQAIGKKKTYMSEKEFNEILEDENLLEQFVVGAVTSGFAQAPSLHIANKSGSDFITGMSKNEQAVVQKEVEKRIAEQEERGKKLTAKEKSEIEFQVEKDMEKGYISTDTIEEVLGGEHYQAYKETIDKENSLLSHQKTLQKEFDQLNDMKQGEMTGKQIDRRTELKEELAKIKETIAATQNHSPKNLLKQRLSESVFEMVKGERLAESYNEIMRRRQEFQDDVTKYKNPTAQKTIQNLLDSKTVNNTNRTRELADTVAKISADKGIVFDFTTNAKLKESGNAYKSVKEFTATGHTKVFDLGTTGIDTDFAPVVKIGGQTLTNFKVDYEKGTITFEQAPNAGKGGKLSVEFRKTGMVNGFFTKDGITINMDSPRYWNFIVGHEVTHSLEKAGAYEELQKAVLAYADAKGELKTRYKSMSGNYNKGTDIDSEVTADLVGEYLFNDYDFVKNLSVENQNIFQKIWSEIKYLLKVVTAGSKEARALERARHNFEKAYRETKQAKTESDADTQYSLVTDKKTIDFLENQEYLTVYKAMVLIDGKLYPPMASQEYVEEEVTLKNGKKKTKRVRKLKNPSILGRWQQSDERPDLITKMVPPSKRYPDGYGSFDLLKSNGKSVKDVAYNPYEHTSNIVLNDQFSEAYQRPELVTVEYHIPVSELTSGYKAQYAKDSVGLTDWKAGGVAQKLKNSHRDVYLTRWSKPVRVVPDAEVAQKYKEILDKEEGISVPWNVVTPSLRTELEKIGVPIDYSDIKAGSTTRTFEAFMRGEYDQPAKKAKKAKETKYSLSDSNGRQLSKEQQDYFKDSSVRDKNGNLMVLYHGTQNNFTVFDIGRSGENYDGWSELGEGIYLTPDKTEAEYYGDNAGWGREVNLMEVYANIKNPFNSNDPVDFDISDLTQEYNLTEFDERFMKMAGNRLLDFLKYHNKSVREYLTSKGFDGVWEKDSHGDVYQVVAYAENQVKNVDNTNPTSDPDIRYSLSDKNIKDISTGYGYGETYYNMSYEQDGKVVGLLQYGEYDGNPNVKMIEVVPEYRRKGIATKLMQALQKKYPDTEIDFGMSTPDGTKLLENITYDVTDESVVADRRKLKNLQAELDELQGKMDVLFEIENLTDEQDAELHNLGDRWQEVYEAIQELEPELRGKRATRTFVKYSLSDNNGNQLSAEQAEFFRDSKIRDNDGNLRVVYHTTKNDFTVFDKSRKGEATEGENTFLGFFFAESPDHMEQFPEFQGGRTDAYYLDMKKPMDLTNLSRESFMDIVELTGGDRMEAAEVYDQELKAEQARARLRGDNNTALSISQLLYNMVGDYYHADFFEALKPNYDKLVAKGYDGVIDYLDEMMGEREFVVFESNQAKLTSNKNPSTDPDIRYSLSNADTDKSYLDAVNSGDTETARKIMEKVAKRRGYTIRAYHGTARGDRVGNVFLPERATSGPMAFFTDSKEIAENYSKSKQDTSMAYDPDYDSYETQFRIKVLDRDIPLYRAWGFLPFDARRRITQKAGQLRENWDGDNELILDPDTNEANGGFQWQLKEARGNAIQALTEQWLNSGNLFNEEARFLDVLEMAGVTEEFKKVKGMGELYFKDPNAKHEKVYDTFLRIRKPFDTAMVDEQFIADLESWYEQQDESKYIRQNMQSDMWDKNGIDAYDFAERLRSDIENNTTHAWTSIPDSVTDFLKHLGYDGIKDTGGKFSGDSHTVWIPFASNQIKSAETVTYDDAGNVIPITERFSRKEVDIRHSLFGKQGTYGTFGVPARDLRVEAAPVQEEVAPVTEESSVVQEKVSRFSVDEMFPDDLTPAEVMLESLYKEKEALEGKMLEASTTGDFSNFDQINADYLSVQERITKVESELSETEDARMSSLRESDMPPEMDAPYPGDTSDPMEPADPFADRDMKDVGNQKIKAYQYENPEVKPFFQEAAYGMLDDLNRSTRGEKIFNGDVYYQSGGEEGWMGTKRQTTPDIAELLDQWHYTYAEIEKGLNAIIEDDGKENNAVSKRIEFMLDERLRNGYTDVWGEPMPANQGYINLLTEKQINEYSQEAFESFFASADQYAPPAREEAVPAYDIGPVYKTDKGGNIEGQQEMWNGAAKEYEAITPKRKAQPKMVRADKSAEQEQIAKILDAEPTPQNRKSRAWARFKANVLDKGAVFEDLSLKTRNRELMGKWNFILSADSRAQRLIGNGADHVKSLNEIREAVETSGKSKQFYEYLYHKHNVDRMNLADRYEDTENKPVFGYSVTSDVSQKIVDQYERAFPSFKRYAGDIYDYMNHLRSLLVDNGVISQDTADLWSEMYPHYVPIRRAGDKGLNINVPLDTGRTGVNAPIKRATGGNRDILPLFDTMAQRTLQTYKAIAKNSFGVELKNALGTTVENNTTGVDEVIDTIDQQEGLLQKGKNGGSPTFTVFEDGEKVTFEITEDMYDALKPVSDDLAYTNKVLNTMSNFHRGLLTEYNPVFMLTNAIKDTQDIMINSQHPARTYLKLGEATMQIAQKGYWYTEYMDNGGEQNTYFDNEQISFDTENKGAAKLLDVPPLSTIGKLNNFIEMTPRLAEYIASREAGRSIEVSMLDAARVTTNFQAGGDLTKFLNRNGATFLNASVQGLMQNVRNFREAKAAGWKGWANLATKFAVAGLPAALLNGLLWDDDEEYEELSDYVKQNYYVVAKTDDGKFIRIPKGRTMAVIQNAVEQVSNALTGDDEVDLNSFLELMVSNLAPNNPIEDNILAPIIQAYNNKTWYGEDLVPTRLQDLPAGEQFDESTDKFSKWLGEKLDISPVKINYLLDQYSGGLGDTFLPMITPEAESGDNSFLGNMLAPLKSKFSTDSVMNNQNVSDFYDTMDKLTTNAKSSKATDNDVLKHKYMSSVNADLGELYAKKREIQNSNLPDDQKYAQVRAIQQEIVNLTRSALNTYENVTINGGYATIGDRYFQRNEEGEWQKLTESQVAKYKATSAAGDSPYATDGTNHYRLNQKDGKPEWVKITDEQLEKQVKVTSGLGISPEEYWGNKDEYDYAYEHPENYAVAKAVGGYDAYRVYSSELYDIKADKDENGKSISGSRKEKVIDYINNLDADYETKIILFKSEYNADDSYNDDIIEYLNSRDDISYEERVTILRKLGFTVSSDGTITW